MKGVSEEPQEDDVPARVFEGLFLGGALLPDDLLSAELARLGFQPGNGRDSYSAKTWREALEVARRHAYPLLTEAEGFRALGRRFAEGFGRTVVGRVFRAVAPLFGVDRTLLSVPRYLHTVRKHMRVELHALEANRYRLVAFDPHPNADFIAGCMLGILDVFSIEGTAVVVVSEADRFELELFW